MVRPRPFRSVYLLIVLASAGCHQGQPRVGPDGSRAATILPVVAADDPVPDLLRHPAIPPAGPLPGGNPDARIYRGLDVAECVALAARNSALAQVLDTKRSSLPCEDPTPHHEPRQRANRLLATGLALDAEEARNQEAGKAAEAFFSLAQAEAQEAIVRRSQAEVAAAIAASRTQLERGLPVQDAYNKLRRQEVELRGRRLKLEETIDRLSAGLRESLLLAPDDADWLVRPVVDWQSSPEIPDAQGAVAVGLANRAQLRLLRIIVMESDQATLAVAGQLLAAIHPLLGIGVPVGARLALDMQAVAAKWHGTEPEAVLRSREQARDVLAWRERAIEAEIRDAALGVLYHLHLVSVARDQYGLRAEELSRLLAKAGRGLTPSLEVSTARLEVFAAESHWIDEVTELRIQRVRLDQAQGLLSGSAPAPAPHAPGAVPSEGMPVDGP